MAGKKNLPDGFEVMTLVKEYMDAIGPAWHVFPTLYTSRFPILLSLRKDIFHQKKSIAKLIRWVVDAFRYKNENTILTQVCDVLIYYSSRKPNVQPAFDLLANRLMKKGYACTNISMEGTKRVGFDRLHVLLFLITSSIDTFTLFFLTLLRNRTLFLLFLKNYFEVRYQLLLGRFRMNQAKHIINAARPRLVITNGDHIPMASELVLESKMKGVHTVWFFNEHPTIGMLPIVSDEVWVWNITVAHTLKKLIRKEKQPTWLITGNAQLNIALSGREEITTYEQKLQQRLRSHPLCLFLSEYDANEMLATEGITAESLRWLSLAAHKCPTWYFLISVRPLHGDKELPGKEYISKYQNIIIPKEQISLRNMLHWKNISVIAACGTSGLYVAAGMGKIALRLIVSKTQSKHQFLDEVTIPILSPKTFISTLQQIEQKNTVLRNYKILVKTENFFPNRFSVVNRMEMFALRHLV